MTHRKEWWAVFVVIAIGAVFLVFVAVRTIGQVLAFRDSANAVAAVDTSGWSHYHNAQYNFDFFYPSDWQVSTDGLNNTTPFVEIGNPLNGTKTYALQIFIQNNPSSLSSGEFVHEMLAADRAQDVASGASKGLAPRVTPQYKSAAILEVGQGSSYEAYELSGVYEFDHNAEQIYVAEGNVVLRFDFPVAEENPNMSLPVANNAVAHEILATLQFSSKE